MGICQTSLTTAKIIKTKPIAMKKSIIIIDLLLILVFLLILLSKFIILPFAKVIQPIFFVLLVVHIIQHWKIIVFMFRNLIKK